MTQGDQSAERTMLGSLDSSWPRSRMQSTPCTPPHPPLLFLVPTQTITFCTKVARRINVSQVPLGFFIPTNPWEVVLSPSNVDSPGDYKDSVVAGPLSTYKAMGHSSLGYRQQAES